MSVSSPFAIQLLSKIGAPLAAAVEAGPSASDEAKSADDMAKMLGLAVEMSIALHGKLDVTEDESLNENLADETRTALASIAAELIADFYITNQKIPDSNDKDRMVKSLESVLGFADKFSSSKDHASRLQTLGRAQVLFDETQSQLVALQSMDGIVSAVNEFPFGQSENKLIQDIAESLQKDAQNLAKENGTNDKLSELMIFKSLASLYAECHRSETKKVLSSGGDSAPSLDPVWASYETRLAMMNALISGVSGDEAQASAAVGGSGDSVAPSIPAEEPVQPLTLAEPAAPVSAPATAGGPMGFFAKKPAGEEAPASAPVAPPPAETPPETSAPSTDTPPVENSTTPKEDPIVPPAPASDTPAEPASEEKPKGEAGNPMSFFKGPPKSDGES